MRSESKDNIIKNIKIKILLLKKLKIKKDKKNLIFIRWLEVKHRLR
jgi:hypothetical protein